MIIIVTIIPRNLVTSLLSSLFCPKTRTKFSASWLSAKEKYFCFFVYSEPRFFLHVIPARIIVPC